jgi:hypothetical protein
MRIRAIATVFAQLSAKPRAASLARIRNRPVRDEIHGFLKSLDAPGSCNRINDQTAKGVGRKQHPPSG